jgi:3-methylcrotonyl-CoA carboxylase alpha subunit
VTPYYDPILSKVVAYGEDRDTARRRMLRALDEYIVHGVKTGIDLHRRILTHAAFVGGEINTAFLDEHADVVAARSADVPDEVFVAAALADELGLGGVTRRRAGDAGAMRENSPWESGGNWEIGGRR